MPVLAHHLIFTGYGHWLPNDPRGSGSRDIRQEILEILGPLHPGRKQIQPARSELKSFYRDAVPLLQHTPMWFDSNARSKIAAAISETLTTRGYTCWACAILSNHMHLCVRRHRDSDEIMWAHLATATAKALRTNPLIPANHPLWADRPYAIFLESPADIRRIVAYIESNPAKESLPPQQWAFTTPYNNWPFHKVRPVPAAKRQSPP